MNLEERRTKDEERRTKKTNHGGQAYTNDTNFLFLDWVFRLYTPNHVNM